MAESITLRAVAAGDEGFLYEVYASTRQEELAPLPWTEAQKAAFLRMQFDAQARHYHEHFSEAAFLVIVRDGRPAGRLYVDRRPEGIRIIDIALLPEHRRAGIGTALFQELLAEGDRQGKPVSLHVEHLNPAMRLYERLGFRKVEDTGVYYLLERPPQPIGDDSARRRLNSAS
jgi:ribosomal protein S18 acetylase RimI-like enzyme